MSTWKTQGLFLLRTLFLGLGLLGLALPGFGQAPTLTVLHSFGSGSDGNNPIPGLIQASDGNFYGATLVGGDYGHGIVFSITPAGHYTVLHAFAGYPSDAGSLVSALLQAKDGYLYGTSLEGGAYPGLYSKGLGAIFKLKSWWPYTETLLYSFQGGSDGANPSGSLIQGSDGNFYGTTFNGGTVYKITPDGTIEVLHTFSGGTDGAYPWAPLIQASDSNFYGTTYLGGTYGLGTVFQITPDGGEDVLHTFTGGTDGANPQAGLIQGADGNFYGTTYSGGTYNYGTVFKVTPAGVETVLHSFSGSSTDGSWPHASLLEGADGNFYGTTMRGGAYNYGTVFKVTPAGVETVLHSFSGSSTDGFSSMAGLLQATDGNLYGTTQGGGTSGAGVVFRLSGVYPLPIITGLLPAICSAGSPDFTLTVKGTGFQTFSTVTWNGAPLTTAFDSPTKLQARVPGSLIASAGTAAIRVVTGAGGGTSNTRNFYIRQTILKLALTSLTKNSDGSFTATISFKNTGYQSAVTILLKRATIGAATTSASLPQSLGTLAAGATGATSLTFPASAGSSGTAVRLRVSGTFTGGSFWYMQKVKLP